MSSIKAHFDGRAVVLDEPAALVVGQKVRVVVDPSADDAATPSPRGGLGAWRGKLEIVEDGDDAVVDHFKEYVP